MSTVELFQLWQNILWIVRFNECNSLQFLSWGTYLLCQLNLWSMYIMGICLFILCITFVSQ